MNNATEERVSFITLRNVICVLLGILVRVVRDFNSRKNRPHVSGSNP